MKTKLIILCFSALLLLSSCTGHVRVYPAAVIGAAVATIVAFDILNPNHVIIVQGYRRIPPSGYYGCSWIYDYSRYHCKGRLGYEPVYEARVIHKRSPQRIIIRGNRRHHHHR